MPSFCKRCRGPPAPEAAPGWDGDGDGGGDPNKPQPEAPQVPREQSRNKCPGIIPFSPLVVRGGGMGPAGRGKRDGIGNTAGWEVAGNPLSSIRGGALRASGRRRLGRHAEGRMLRSQKGLISFCSTS